MLSTLFRSTSRRACIAAAVLAGLASANFAHAEEKSPYSVSLGTDVTSHFISYGADVWGGGKDPSPLSAHSTIFGYGTISCSLADNLSVFLNIWSDNNDNVDSGIGGAIQEIDVNTGITYTWESLSFTLAHGFWNYAGDVEKVVDFTVGFADADMITHSKEISLNPSVNFHYRYEGDGGQDTGLAVVPGISPSYTLMPDSKYPVTLSVPLAVGIFTSNFQGGDGGYGFFSGGVTASVPLAFIPEKYGAWSASVNATYYNTPKDQVPNNPVEDFVTTTVSLHTAF